jgi:REP element-mobilizing transposase RayT
MERRGPGYQALRRGRASIENAACFITTRTAGQRPILTDRENAQIVVDGLNWLREQDRIWLLGYVVMPDHVHVVMVMRGEHRLPMAMRTWKGVTSRHISRRTGIRAPIWQDGYYDHMVRNDEDLRECLAYLHYNPVRRGLARNPEEYEFSTANPKLAGDVDEWWMV